MKVLVTGGEGFVGHHLSKRLINLGHEVTILDKFRPGELKRDKLNATYNLLGTKNISQLSTDFDWIFHLGEYSRVENSFTHTNKVWESNVAGTTAVMDSLDNQPFNVKDSYVSLLEILMLTVFGAYFAGRTVEKTRK